MNHSKILAEFRKKFGKVHESPCFDATEYIVRFLLTSLDSAYAEGKKDALKRVLESLGGMEVKELFVGETQYRFYKGNIDWVYNSALTDARTKIKGLIKD